MILVFTLISFFLLCNYLFLVGLVRTKWVTTPELKIRRQQGESGPFITLIVVARNEESTIVNCLKSISRNSLSPSQYEILLIDDHSTDATAELARRLLIDNLHILHLNDYKELNEEYSYKKQAIQFAVGKANGDVIALTDADCTVSPNWLSTIRNYFAKHQPDVVAGPVFIEGRPGQMIEVFQTVEMMGTIAFTQAGISSGLFHLANGANLSFKRRIFTNLKAYETNLEYASGDDVFLVQEAAKKRDYRIRFIKSKECIVKTKAMPSVNTLINQRLRWARKSFAYKEYNLFFILGMIFLFHVSMLSNLVLAIIYVSIVYLLMFVIQVLIKFFIDLWLLKKVSSFFGYPLTWRGVTWSFVIQWIYLLVVGVGSLIIKRSEWKQRKIY